MSRHNDFTIPIKKSAIRRQKGKCAFCGVTLKTPWTKGKYEGCAHHLKPLRHGGKSTLSNCVYLCWGHHQYLGHGMAPFGIDKQGGSSSTWVQLGKEEFEYWDGQTRR
jgi:predicted restriction endonuclease